MRITAGHSDVPHDSSAALTASMTCRSASSSLSSASGMAWGGLGCRACLMAVLSAFPCNPSRACRVAAGDFGQFLDGFRADDAG